MERKSNIPGMCALIFVIVIALMFFFARCAGDQAAPKLERVKLEETPHAQRSPQYAVMGREIKTPGTMQSTALKLGMSEYSYALGENYPDSYQKINDIEKLRSMMQLGDRFAASRLGDILVFDGNDVESAIEAYKRAAELGSPAALAKVGALRETDNNMLRDQVQAKFGSPPAVDMSEAYVSAKIASLRGYHGAYFILDRLMGRMSRQQIAQADYLASAEYDRLLKIYIQRYGRNPVVPLDPAAQDAFNRALRANCNRPNHNGLEFAPEIQAKP